MGQRKRDAARPNALQGGPMATAKVIHGWLVGIVAVYLITSSVVVVLAASAVTAVIVVSTTLSRR
jgi:hypothetical protein